MKKVIFTVLSTLFSLMTIGLFMINIPFKVWNDFIEYLWNMSLYIPFVFSGLGIITACFGVKGIYRTILILLNSIIIIFLIISFIMGLYGFNEP
ncbi:hypothetical protein D5F11_008845 [Siminovitchia terrae]|uniref:NADH dehydrogenase subunit 5 n=1 Tax=Siminovitchia terrae TaxID=1914933 RepID=A0A429X9P8_SIMTE|nr:hypothetical protein [Siminovitchia terrae]RST60155.1 hypothetical protein D5F11_008845 [Siminovitchia terrae]